METRMGQRREWRDREDSETPTALRRDRDIARESDRGLAGVHGDGEGAARVMPADYATIERIASDLCHLSGGVWDRKGTKRNLWRKRAMALVCLANGDRAGARRAMRGRA